MASEDQKKEPQTAEKRVEDQTIGVIQPEDPIMFEFDNRPRFRVCEYD